MTLKQALSNLPDGLKFLDESERLTQEHEKGFESVKKFISGSKITTSENGLPMHIIENQIEKNGQRVLTTAQLAEAYKTTAKTINDNFSNNKEHYIEGVHYYCLKGDELKAFKNYTKGFGVVSKRTAFLYLWTEKGALLHAKSLNTKKAWEVYAFLLENYFHIRQIMTSYDNMLMQIIENQKAIQNQINALEKKFDDIINYHNHIIMLFVKVIIEMFK